MYLVQRNIHIIYQVPGIIQFMYLVQGTVHLMYQVQRNIHMIKQAQGTIQLGLGIHSTQVSVDSNLSSLCLSGTGNYPTHLSRTETYSSIGTCIIRVCALNGESVTNNNQESGLWTHLANTANRIYCRYSK